MLQRLRDAALALHRTTAERDELLRRANEPIAIVGMGCRFPGGVDDPESYWRLLDGGHDAIVSLDARWRLLGAHPAEGTPSWAGLLDEVDRFDAAFFGIAPREAVTLDPQHRLLLEIAWEALEDAGIVPRTLEGSRAGIFVGSTWADYAHSVRNIPDEAKDAYAGTGNMPSVAAGRIAYTLGLHGPCVTVDTACSSSLVTVHLACESLRKGDCDLALAGGVNLLLSAETMTTVFRLQALSPQGRCRTFDAGANGMVRGEGCGLVVLKRLSDARRDGDRIWATIRGSAINQDGRSNGLTAPNGPAQEALLRAALKAARVAPESVGYVEAHGTGTSLGDPIECEALGNVIGAPRSDGSRCLLGSVKTNLGHLEGAAGIAGLMKAVLALVHERIPKNLNFRTLNPRIHLAGSSLAVAAEGAPWPRGEAPRFAGVSSFGISGTNAHVVLEQAPTSEVAPAAVRDAELVVLSAKTPGALAAAARRLRDHLDRHPEVQLGEISYSLMSTRSSMERRLALAVRDRDALRDALAAVASGESLVEPPEVPTSTPPKVAFVFPGQGSQWIGMGRELLAGEPAFREALTACDRAIAAEAGWSVIKELLASAETSQLERIDVVQPVLFAIEVALAALWRSWGVEPQAVVGHSMGEVAAACVAGALSLEDGAAIMCRRSALLKRVSGRGEMALVELSIDEASLELVGLEDRLGVAASNGRRSTVISGEPAAMAHVLTKLEGRGIFSRRIKVDVASHSPQMDPLLDELAANLKGVHPRASRVAIRSTVTGAVVEGQDLVGSYWVTNLRAPVRFHQAIEGLVADGFTIFVEMSPHPILGPSVEEVRQAAGVPGLVAASLRRDQPERLTLLASLGALYIHGHSLDASRVFPGGGRRVPLPTYAWQRDRYWVSSSPARRSGGRATEHPLLGVRMPVAGAAAVYESLWSVSQPEWLGDHRVAGQVLLSGTTLAELARAAAEDHAEGRALQVAGLVLQAPMVVPEGESRRVQVVLADDGGRLSIYSQSAGAAPGAVWTLHATGELSPAPQVAPSRLDMYALRARCADPVATSSIYARLIALGMVHGPSFQGLRSVARGRGEALAEVALPEGLSGEGYGVHPALLDAALQTIFGALDAPVAEAMMPFELGRLVVHTAGVSSAFVHATVASQRADGIVADVKLADVTGEVIAEIDRLTLRRRDPSAIERHDAAPLADAFYRLDWQASQAPGLAKATGTWAVVSMGDGSRVGGLADALRALEANCQTVDVAELSSVAAQNVVCVWSGDGGPGAAMGAAIDGLAIVRALADRKDPPRLWWVTTCAVAVAAGEVVAVAGSPIWGLGRTLMLEHPALRCTLLDLHAEAPVAEILLRELAAADGESQVAWRGAHRHVARLVHAPPCPVAPVSGNYRLEANQKGTLDGLAPVAVPRIPPAPGEVEIEVRASGMNFRDAVMALGMYPGARTPLGAECAGVVVRKGSEVSSVALGDRVMAIAVGSFSRFVTVDARWVAQAPRGLSFEEAATVPAVFLTAWYALYELARLKRGERIVIHAAAGGVGMAAVQLAQAIGAEVLATASPSKWETVRSLGVTHVASSRELTFVAAFRAARGGADVVLNSLAGEFVDAGLSLLSKGGRFIEMGKTDIRDAAAVAAAHPGVAYQAFDLLVVDPDKIAAMFREITDGFASGRLKALPVRVYPMAEVETAFRFMAQARHVGKLALLPAPESLRTDGTTLIVGGLGGLGLEVARELASRGMKHLVLVGRRGLATPGAPAAIEAIEALGAVVTVAPIDACDRQALGRVIRAVPPGLPLRAVIHAAVVLDDGPIGEQTPERFRRVLAPKIEAAWNLHVLTEGVELDAFVLFSSLTGTLGNAGQSAYAAANAALDALAAHRRANGQAAQSLAWGPWAERGAAAALAPAVLDRLARKAYRAVSPSQGVALFGAALARPEALLVIVPLDLRVATKAFAGAVPPVWRALVRASPVRTSGASASWAHEVAALPADQRSDALRDAVRGEVARVLSLGRASVVPPDKPLRDLGLDSLMAVELRNALARRAGVSLPSTLAFDHPTSAAIARYLLDEVPAFKENPAAPEAPPAVSERPAPIASAAGPSTAITARADRIERIPMGERWMADAFRVIPPAGGYAQRAADMTWAMEAVRTLNAAGIRATLPHAIVRAASLALARNPELHQTVCGYRKLTPGQVDIGLSMAGQTTYAPVVVLPAVDRQTLGDLVPAIEEAVVAARKKEAVDLANLRKVGWMTPIGFLRRFAIRVMQEMFWFRRKIVGTFQVSTVPTAEVCVPFQFYTGSILTFGRPRDAVVAIDGRPAIRPMLTLTVAADHVAMDGLRAAALVNEIAAVLESDELVHEAQAAAEQRRTSDTSGVRALPEARGAAVSAE